MWLQTHQMKLETRFSDTLHLLIPKRVMQTKGTSEQPVGFGQVFFHHWSTFIKYPNECNPGDSTLEHRQQIYIYILTSLTFQQKHAEREQI